MATTVISVRGKDRAILQADPNFVYVGRRCAGWPASPFGNPFKRGMDIQDARKILIRIGSRWMGSGNRRPIDIAEAVECYREWVTAQPDLMLRVHEKLRGRVLGCWCGSWEPGRPDLACHAVVLARLADELSRVAVD